jgi:hypothetical protein
MRYPALPGGGTVRVDPPPVVDSFESCARRVNEGADDGGEHGVVRLVAERSRRDTGG